MNVTKNNLANQKMLENITAECSSNVTLTQKEARRFFKTSHDSYSAHDEFLGITVPTLRKIAKKYQHAPQEIVISLLTSSYNEKRLLALFILVHQYQRGTFDRQEEIYHFYLNNRAYVNNWNLVDSSAHYIVGHYLCDKDRSLLIELAKSSILWDRRISIVATWYFMRKSDTKTTFELATILLNDKHDLIHKAVGWMLREAGKKDETQLLQFLSQHAKQMPKTMLRYAIEKLTNQQIISLKI